MSKVLNQDLASTMEGQQTRLGKIQSAHVDRVFNAPAVTYGSSAAAKFKTTNTIYPFINGVMIAGVTTAETTVPTVTVTNGNYAAFMLTYDTTNGLMVTFCSQAATLAGVTFPTVPANTALVGICTIHPTGTGNFVGGTTSFTDGTVTPNAVFFDAPHFNPNMLTL